MLNFTILEIQEKSIKESSLKQYSRIKCGKQHVTSDLSSQQWSPRIRESDDCKLSQTEGPTWWIQHRSSGKQMSAVTTD